MAERQTTPLPPSGDVSEVPCLVRRLYEVVDELTELFPDRRFTPDGHMVGSIGEVLAAWRFDLKLANGSNEGFDAWTRGLEETVEIKTTQGKRILLDAGIRHYPDYLIALKLDREGHAEVIFNGPARVVWEAAGAAQKNGPGESVWRRYADSTGTYLWNCGFPRCDRIQSIRGYLH